jgi:hypothetical protein
MFARKSSLSEKRLKTAKSACGWLLSLFGKCRKNLGALIGPEVVSMVAGQVRLQTVLERNFGKGGIVY